MRSSLPTSFLLRSKLSQNKATHFSIEIPLFRTISVWVLKGLFLQFASSTLETNLTPRIGIGIAQALGGALGMANSLTEAIALPYLGIKPDVLSLDDKAELLLFDQGITTAVVLGIIYTVANTFQPLPEEFFKYDLREPFNLQKGWLLWAGVGLVGALIAISLTGVAVSFFSGETPERETDALVRLLPLIGSSNLSTACLLGITGVLAPLLEETWGLEKFMNHTIIFKKLGELKIYKFGAIV
ncbi:hypothetical protein CR513_06167 [Mucuna pruriens]|uniref:Uncharacterized protein n=1 Tax=Mucuna pruriens TaxID=157652 RepID=A0A371I358_MUCPR|nr:hypothetical protein CR513_06167 [Mucuna pruriens]